MNLEELLLFKPRCKGVVVKAVSKKRKSNIVMADNAEMTVETTTFTVVSLDEAVDDLKVGDEVFPTGAAFIPLQVDGCPKDTAYFYCPDNFIKMYKR